jgi:hypothetical protein
MISSRRGDRVKCRAAIIILVGAACACRSQPSDRNVRGTELSVARTDPATRTILPMDLPPGVFGRCDRSLRAGASPRWMPPPTLVERVDAELAAVLDSVLTRVESQVGNKIPDQADYYRQYSGVIIHGRRQLYVNGFHRSLLRGYSGAPPSDTLEWRSFPVASCDSGVLITDSYAGRIRY